MKTHTLFETAWGVFGFVSQEETLLATYLPRSPVQLMRLIHGDEGDLPEDPEALPDLRRKIQAYYEGVPVDLTDVRVDDGDVTPFQRAVIRACRAIPYGSTASYGELAAQAGNPRAARAAGAVMASNRRPLVVPCHRVLRAGGGLGGFSSSRGLEEKRDMLALERQGLLIAPPPKTPKRKSSKATIL